MHSELRIKVPWDEWNRALALVQEEWKLIRNYVHQLPCVDGWMVEWINRRDARYIEIVLVPIFGETCNDTPYSQGL